MSREYPSGLSRPYRRSFFWPSSVENVVCNLWVVPEISGALISRVYFVNKNGVMHKFFPGSFDLFFLSMTRPARDRREHENTCPHHHSPYYYD